MNRKTGTHRVSTAGGERVRAFIPHPLPPRRPPLQMTDEIRQVLSDATAAIGKLEVAAEMVPSTGWFLYGFVRKEALVSSQIEGTQATLEDVFVHEATQQASRPFDVEEVCNYVEALEYARREIAKPKGLPLCSRLLCSIHKRLMKGVRGSEKSPGQIRTTQNWIGGTRPGNAYFVPPPPDLVPEALAALDTWLHHENQMPPLLRIGLAHVQFETIHPFLDGNGRIGRLLVTLLFEHWKLLSLPILYLSLAFKQHREEYYRRLDLVRSEGDWEGWTQFFLECVRDSAEDGVNAARRLHVLLGQDRQAVVNQKGTTIPAVRLFDLLPEHPMVTLASTQALLETTKPTATKAIKALCDAGVLHEITGKQRDRIYAYQGYLEVLAEDTDLPSRPLGNLGSASGN